VIGIVFSQLSIGYSMPVLLSFQILVKVKSFSAVLGLTGMVKADPVGPLSEVKNNKFSNPLDKTV
jgi:hypothetical protein